MTDLMAYTFLASRVLAFCILSDAGVRTNAQQPRLFVGMILILVFVEARAPYGLIVGIILSSGAAMLGQLMSRVLHDVIGFN